jgi:hypothetical protein
MLRAVDGFIHRRDAEDAEDEEKIEPESAYSVSILGVLGVLGGSIPVLFSAPSASLR